jgi:Tol biopolymer transport system component
MKKAVYIICVLITVFTSINLFAQLGTEIIVFDISVRAGGISLSNPVNITNHKGYDNQPFFYKNNIYYSSAADSAQMDIKKYDLITKKTQSITNTNDNEFSPTVTPDRKFISCILQRKNGRQDLVKYPINGGKADVIIGDMKVGYHTWIDNNKLLLFVLEDTTTNALYIYSILTKERSRITDGIGRSLHKIPGGTSLSFIKKTNDNWLINKIDIATKKITPVKPTMPKREDITWTKSGLIITSDGNDLFYGKPGTNQWKKISITDTTPLKNITRLAINEANTKLAIVIAE